ncbi:LOW QUALITY PROTEIN: vacuolar protein sorting-associated protein 13B [Drosophila obscura]|uniref:LOW QUALITY PROTEIN: vacuolar protein sorting-associated protein 13B n=1 Tax=Drosophila obscura TaxID=7282 RepID=UPI001BB1E501|nr:LOW QUALITY PROTEIN: vacuolar protein sorting-associated protein 13B [Drosophila obscura]
MFKLESYITPILLSYVAKYVKNFRDEDAQVSLWEGEVTFQNLDLRLEVLEEELNLPVELVSGHIHELSIQVPWTKLMSEPVKIIINTIEFVAKLPDNESKQRRASYQKEQRRKAKKAAMEAEQQQGGTAPASSSIVVNKIINNITLQCHNIILKYVEDDIVVSMNVQCLNFSPAGENWKPTMVDVHQVSVLMRKLLQISDLTICLDKRNTAGRIEVCQEPVLYRCTLECRVLRKYNANTVRTSSTTRIGVFTKAFDINVSSLQFPMVMRLIKMLLELKPAEMEEEIPNLDDPEETAEGNETPVGGPQPESQSYLWWAWNLLPSFESQAPANADDETIGHSFDMGIYAEELNFQLKNSEYFTDQAMGGMKRIRYTPILRISLGGIYYERSQLKENDWTNVKAGLSSICMEPLGAYRSEDPVDRVLVNTQESLKDRSFIDKSLFDEHFMFSDRTWSSHNYEDYVARNTDEYMLFRSPVLSFDIVEYRAPKSNSHPLAESQLKDLGLRIQYRLLSAGISFHFSQSFLQVKNVISDLLRPYDYSGYHSESINVAATVEEPQQQELKNTDMTLADLEYLIGFAPTCNYKIELRNMTIQLYPRQQPEESSAANQHQLATTVKQSLLPYLQLRFPLVEGTLCGPVNAQRLVQLITQLQDKPRELINSCYTCYRFNVKNLTLTILNTTPENGRAKLLNIPRMQLNVNRLLLPHLWRPNDAALETVEIQSEILTVEFSKRELILAKRIIPLIMSFSGPELCSLSHLVAQSTASSDVIKLQTLATKLRLNCHRYHTHLSANASLRSLNTDAYHSKMNMRNVVLSTTKDLNNKWLEVQLQLPLQEASTDQERMPATVLCLWAEPFRFTTDIYLLQFLNFSEHTEKRKSAENEIEMEVEAAAPSQSEQQFPQSVSNYSTISATALPLQPRRISRNNSRKISVPEETVHLSSERDERHTQTEPIPCLLTDSKRDRKSDIDLGQLVKRLSSMVVLVEIAQVRIDVCELMVRMSPAETNVEYTSIRLPRMKIKSSNCDTISRGNIRSVILVAAKADLINWVTDLNDLNVCYCRGDTTEVVLAPVRTTITLAMSHKLAEGKQQGSIHSKKTPEEDQNKEDHSDHPVEQRGLGTYSINVHVDMSSINVFARRVKLLHEHYKIISEIQRSLSPEDDGNVKWSSAPRLEVYTGSSQNYPAIKEFLELDPNFEPPQAQNVGEVDFSLIFFCQWTIPRISFEMESPADRKQNKIVVTFEDLLLNVDKHSDFTKITTKVENLGLDYYEAKPQGEWLKKDGFYIKMLGDSFNLPLISVVVTTVSLQNLYSKIGARNPRNKQHTISELLIEVQPIEMVLDLDQITDFVIPLCGVIEIMRGNNEALDQRPAMESRVTTVQDLPMVHLISKGIYIYLPLATGRKSCSVLLLRIENVQLTPSLENPLVRQLVRQDIYQKAAELNMLSTPGALVEDRQYELSVKKVSLSTGNWLQTQKYHMEKSLASEHNNPAFEWNNQTRPIELDHMDIFRDFDFIMVYAPAIIYDRFFVCGQSVEYNCVTDFVATLTTHQINLITCILVRFQRLYSVLDQVYGKQPSLSKMSSESIQGILSSPVDISARSSRLRQSHSGLASAKRSRSSFVDARSSSDVFMGSCQSDSGIHIGGSSRLMGNQKSQEGLQPSVVSYPQSVSFVAGIFVLKIYDVLQLEELELEVPVMKPLIMLTVSQPSYMCTRSLKATIRQASIFNLNVAGATPGTESAVGEFNEAVFDTLPGTLSSSGIPPPLLTVRSQCDRIHQTEVDVEVRKPIVLRLCESSVQQLASDAIRIYSVLLESPCFAVRSERPVVQGPQLRQMKHNCYNADRLNLAFDQITIKLFDAERSYKCSSVWLDFNTSIKFNPRPQKAVIRSTIGSFYIQAGEKIFLHPLLMRLSMDLVSEPWSDDLLINATLKLHFLHIDASVWSILQLQKAHEGLRRILDHGHREWQSFLRHRPVLGIPAEVAPETLVKCNPSKDSIGRHKRQLKTKAEFYQDDLRAGAFQFVYLNSESVLPMPYQVQIIKKNYGIICWRYPQPRQMTSIHIYPIPMPVSNPIHIMCRMEYFSETHETFLHYCDFQLSETATRQLSPPDRQICANIWRVVILQSLISVDGTCFEGDEDEDLHSIDSSRIEQAFKTDADNDFILHPKVLVGCMRIDTIFRAEKVPKLQLLLCCQDMEVNLLNLPDAKGELPSLLKEYSLKRTTDCPQTFLTVHVGDLQVHSAVYATNDFSLETDLRARVTCLDYGFLNMLDIVEPVKFSSYAMFAHSPRSLKANFLLDKLRFNCAPYMIHTLLSSKQHWLEVLRNSEIRHTLMPKCVVVNRMQANLGFGQTGTSEQISLAPQELQLYHFRSCVHGQELTFFVRNPETNQMEASSSLHIALKFEEEQRVRHLRVGKCCITIKVGKLSATQIYILVKGQIEVISMMPFDLITEFRHEGKRYDEHTSPHDHLLLARGRASFYQTVVRNGDINLRLKFAAGRGKGRTGDIPLKTNNNLPWLVKVPTQSSFQQFVSLWVRILREDVDLDSDSVDSDFYPQKILICIWPIFEVCNMLSGDLQATEDTTGDSSQITAHGGRWSLQTATTHSTEHRVGFQFPAPLCSRGLSQDNYTFMLKAMDWHKFFYFDPALWTVENSLHQLGKTLKPMWPLNDDEELRVRRHVRLESTFDVEYRVHATREFSCTLGLEVSAWGMFINATGLDLSICQTKDRERHQLKANCLELVPKLCGVFTIDVPFGCSWIASTPIYLEELAKTVENSPKRSMMLRPSSYVDIVVVRNEEVLRMMLEYRLEDGRRVFKLRSKFVITNFTDVSLNALPLTMDHKETSTREEVNAYSTAKRSRSLVSVDGTKNCSGVTVDFFHDLNARAANHTCDTAFVYFLCFSVAGGRDISIPIPLAIPFTRRCFSLQTGRESVPFMITLIEKDNVHYLSIFRDTAPALIISNSTNVKFIVAQTSASGNSNVTCTNSEFVGRHFEWNQLVSPHSKCYYTPPQMYANFPDVEFTMCNLSLAVYNDKSCGKKKLGWSKPIRTDKSWKKFLHVPSHGDVKVVVCDKHRVIRVNIYYIAQQLEFSVKDLRSRLKKPENRLLSPEEDPERNLEEAETATDTAAAIHGLPLPDIVGCAHFSEECEVQPQIKIRIFVKRFVFSLQTDNREKDYLKTEVCNIYADDSMLAYDDDEDQRVLRLQLPNLQVDNQLYASGKYDFPVLLCAEQLYRRHNGQPQVYDLDEVYQQQAQSGPVSLLTFYLYQDEVQLQSVRCHVQPFRVYIEDAYLNQLLETLVECEPSHCVHTPREEQDRILLPDGQILLPDHVVAQSLYIAEPLRLNSFTVEPLSLLLSVHTSSRLYIALDHSPLSFSRYERQQILTVPLRFGQSLGLHYLSGAIFGAGWVVGSLEILGSPSGLARSFSTGLRDFISMPVQGLFRGPWGFMVGVTQGSASLLRNVTAGTVNSVTKLAGSVARNLDRLTLDAEHIELTEARRRARPQGFADGLTQGLTGLGISLLGAVGGLAHHTLEARSSVGVIAGLTKGIVGAFTKPISGAAEMLALTGQGVLHTVGFNAMPQQVEPSVSRNMDLHPSAYRIWSNLPEELRHAQILFFCEITLHARDQLRPALLFLTASVLAIMESDNDDLTFASAVSKVAVAEDRDDPTKFYLSLRPEQMEDFEGQMNYTNERILKFLNTSRLHTIANDSLSDIFQLNELEVDHQLKRQTQCIFYIQHNFGRHLIHYLKVIGRMQASQ